LPTTNTAKKAMRLAEKNKMRNKSIVSMTKTRVSKAEKAVSAGNADEAKVAVAEAISALDKEAEKGVVHRNNAARRKSRLMKKLNKSAAPAKTPAPEAKKS
jgi:small subunit ribosomal protein S20